MICVMQRVKKKSYVGIYNKFFFVFLYIWCVIVGDYKYNGIPDTIDYSWPPFPENMMKS